MPKAVPPSKVVIADALFPNYGKFPVPPGLPFTKAVKVNVTAATDPAWKTYASIPLPGAVTQGDVLVAWVWARGVSPTAEVRFELIKTAQPFFVLAGKTTRLGDKWERIAFAGKASSSIPDKGLFFKANLGYAKQILALGPIRVENFGSTTMTPDEVLASLP